MTGFSLLFLLMIVGLYASTFKLAALLYRRARLRWRDAVIISLILMAVFGTGVLLNRLSGDVIPGVVGIVATLVIQVGIGAWYFATRAHSRDGQAISTNGAATLALIAYAFLVPLVLMWAEMVSVMRH
jgi:hypothetical protein